MVDVPVVIALLNDHGSVAVLMITVADDVAVTVAVPVTISVTLTNRYANRADTNSHFFRCSRHCAANPSDGGDHYGILNHCVLLSLLSSARAMPRRRDRSGKIKRGRSKNVRRVHEVIGELRPNETLLGENKPAALACIARHRPKVPFVQDGIGVAFR
jgi:hypothetical protein